MARDGSNPEDEYFHREDQERLRRLKEQQDAAKAEADKKALRELHLNHCGKCGTKMDTRLFRGVEIEVCPACNAVLLDPGELETLVGTDHAGQASWFTDFFSFTRNKKG